MDLASGTYLPWLPGTYLKFVQSRDSGPTLAASILVISIISTTLIGLQRSDSGGVNTCHLVISIIISIIYLSHLDHLIITIITTLSIIHLSTAADSFHATTGMYLAAWIFRRLYLSSDADLYNDERDPVRICKFNCAFLGVEEAM